MHRTLSTVAMISLCSYLLISTHTVSTLDQQNRFSDPASSINCQLILISDKVKTESSSSLTFTAALLVENDVEVKTRLTGIIEEIYVERGSRVNKGTPLARLQNNDLALEVQKADFTMQELKAEYLRAKSLYDEKLLSESNYDQKRLQYEKAVAEYDLAKVNFEKSVIKAPFGGMVTERYVKIGQRVVEDDNAPLFRITAMEPLLARIFVPEEQLTSFSVGLRAEFVPTISTSRRFAARVKWISTAIDPASGTAPVLIEILSGQSRGILKPGTSGKVTIWPEAGKGKGLSF